MVAGTTLLTIVDAPMYQIVINGVMLLSLLYLLTKIHLVVNIRSILLTSAKIYPQYLGGLCP